MGNHWFVGIYRGIIIPGSLRWCRISSIHSMQTKKHRAHANRFRHTQSVMPDSLPFAPCRLQCLQPLAQPDAVCLRNGLSIAAGLAAPWQLEAPSSWGNPSPYWYVAKLVTPPKWWFSFRFPSHQGEKGKNTQPDPL